MLPSRIPTRGREPTFHPGNGTAHFLRRIAMGVLVEASTLASSAAEGSFSTDLSAGSLRGQVSNEAGMNPYGSVLLPHFAH